MTRISNGRLVIEPRRAAYPRKERPAPDTRTLAQKHDDAAKLHAPDCRSGACAGCASERPGLGDLRAM